MRPTLTAVALLALVAIPAVTADAQCPGGSCARRPAMAYYVVPAALTTYRLADSSGQAWTHADPAYLSSWVASRNRALATPPALPAVPNPVAASVPSPPNPPVWAAGDEAYIQRSGYPGVLVHVRLEEPSITPGHWMVVRLGPGYYMRWSVPESVLRR